MNATPTASAAASRRGPRGRASSYVVLTALLVIVVVYNAREARNMVDLLDFGDFRIFHRAAAAYFTGGDMYAQEAHSVVVGGRRITYMRPDLNPPHFHLLLLPLARLPVGSALVLWSLASAASLLICLKLIVRESGLILDPLVAMRGVVWLLAFVGTAAVISTAQIALVLLLPVTLAWVGARQGKWTSAGAYLGLAMSFKAFLVIFMPYLLLRRRFAAAISACLTLLGCLGLGLAVFGLQAYREWAGSLGGVDWTWMVMNASLEGLLSRLLTVNPVSPWFAPFVAFPDLVKPLWGALSAVVGLITLFVVADDEHGPSVDRNFALLLLAALLISPLGWLYYLWLPLGPVVALATGWWVSRDSPRSGASGSVRWRNRLVWLAAPGFFLPSQLTFAFQPSPWATLLLGSLHSWAILLLWTALVIDATGADVEPVPRVRLSGSGSATGLRGAQ